MRLFFVCFLFIISLSFFNGTVGFKFPDFKLFHPKAGNGGGSGSLSLGFGITLSGVHDGSKTDSGRLKSPVTETGGGSGSGSLGLDISASESSRGDSGADVSDVKSHQLGFLRTAAGNIGGSGGSGKLGFDVSASGETSKGETGATSNSFVLPELEFLQPATEIDVRSGSGSTGLDMNASETRKGEAGALKSHQLEVSQPAVRHGGGFAISAGGEGRGWGSGSKGTHHED